MKTTLTICLLAIVSMGLAPTAAATDCSPLDPGIPGPGSVGAAQWFAMQEAFLACTMEDAVEDSTMENGGVMASKLVSIASGAGDLIGAAGLVPGTGTFAGTATMVATSQAHDACGAVVGDSNPLCGSDPLVSQAQQCPGGAAAPNPIGGGLAGNTLVNSNGALQATCLLGSAVAANVPNQGQVTTYASATQATLLSLNGDVFNVGSDTLDAACRFAVGTAPCI